MVATGMISWRVVREPTALMLLLLASPEGAWSMTMTTRISTPIVTMVTPAAAEITSSLEEMMVFDELPAPLARVLLSESGAAVGRDGPCHLLGSGARPARPLRAPVTHTTPARR